MLDLLKKVGEVLAGDVTIQSYVGSRIYLALKPIINKATDFPQITIRANEGPSNTTLEVYFPDLDIHIWTKNSQTQANLIGKRVLELLDGKAFVSGTTTIFRLAKDAASLAFEDDTQIFQKVLSFTCVTTAY